jgi:hypothetical protein
MKTPLRWIAFAIVLMLTTIPPANAEQFGNFGVGTQPSGALTPNYKRVSKIVLTEPAVLSGLYIYLDGKGGPQSGEQPVSAVIYSDDNGVPGAKLYQSAPDTVRAAGEGYWHYYAAPQIPMPTGTYWIGIHSGGTVAIARDFANLSSATTWYGNADTFADEATGVFGAGSPGTAAMSIVGLYFPPQTISIAGRATIASTPSGGLSANFKRGSRFTMPVKGNVRSLSAYLDSLGGGTATQSVRLALYRDAGGTPGDLIATSREITLAAGSAGQWRTADLVSPTFYATLEPGDYWIVIHSGGGAGVIRDFGDGASNWYGNADPYADGSSSPFGAGSTGTVTISAAALYNPLQYAGAKLGRRTIAATPSGGLTANFIRGGSYSGYMVPSTMYATAFWAYLDGNGGASGSQQLRMVLYEDDQYHGNPASKFVTSDVVTIPAGQPPGWVRFPISGPPVEFGGAPLYWIALQSGPTGGIVRDYGDGSANWIGESAPFASGAPDDFHTQGQFTTGSVEISMYLEYSSGPP